MPNTTKEHSRLVLRAGYLSLLAFGFLICAQGTAEAATVASILCSIYNQMGGDAGRAMATLAVAAIGVGALFGKVSWGMAILVAVGIAVLFSAGTLVGSFGVGGSGC